MSFSLDADYSIIKKRRILKMIILIIIIALVVVAGLIKDAAHETKTMHHINKTVDQNWEKLKEHYRKEGLDIK